MPEYVMRFRFPAPDDDRALRRAWAMAGTIVAEWEDNRLEWEGVERVDGTRVEPQPGEVDPVLVCAAWGGQARPVESDEDMERVVARIIAALQTRYVPPPPGSDRDALPGHIRAAIALHMPPYISTYEQTADGCGAAAHDYPEMAEELRTWADRMRVSCRQSRKQDLAPCEHPKHREQPAGPGSEDGQP